MSTHSITELLQQLLVGKSDAARDIWERYFTRLIRLAHARLQEVPRRAFDEEDVAITVFEAFFRGVTEDRFKKLENRDDLWQILAMLTQRGAVAFLRHELAEKRGAGKIRGESVFDRLDDGGSAHPGLDQIAEPHPAAVDQFTQDVRSFLDGISDNLLRKIVIAKLEGNTNYDVALRLGISLRSVERKLHLIRLEWELRRSDE